MFSVFHGWITWLTQWGTSALATDSNVPRQMVNVVFDTMQEYISSTDSIIIVHYQACVRPRDNPVKQSRVSQSQITWLPLSAQARPTHRMSHRLVRNQTMVPGTSLNPCISLHTSWHGKGRATFVPFLTHSQGDKRSIQVLTVLFPTCLPPTGKNTLCKDHFMPSLAQKQHDDCYWTNSISQTCPRDL